MLLYQFFLQNFIRLEAYRQAVNKAAYHNLSIGWKTYPGKTVFYTENFIIQMLKGIPVGVCHALVTYIHSYIYICVCVYNTCMLYATGMPQNICFINISVKTLLSQVRFSGLSRPPQHHKMFKSIKNLPKFMFIKWSKFYLYDSKQLDLYARD